MGIIKLYETTAQKLLLSNNQINLAVPSQHIEPASKT